VKKAIVSAMIMMLVPCCGGTESNGPWLQTCNGGECVDVSMKYNSMIVFYHKIGTPVKKALKLGAETYKSAIGRSVFSYPAELPLIDPTDIPEGFVYVYEYVPENGEKQAVASLTLDDEGRVVKAKISFPLGVFGESINRAIVHELGHVLGLGHNEVDTSSVMYPIAYEGIWRLTCKEASALRARYQKPRSSSTSD